MRSSSQARSATQSTGLTWRGASALASSASRSAICAQREASGVSIRRIRLDRKAPLAPPQGSAPSPSSAGSSCPTTRGSRRAQPGYSTGGGGGGRLRSAKLLRPRFRRAAPASTDVRPERSSAEANRRRRSIELIRCAGAGTGAAASAQPPGQAPEERRPSAAAGDQQWLNAHCRPKGRAAAPRLRSCGRLLLRHGREEKRAPAMMTRTMIRNAIRGMASVCA